jgi:glycosyltransferase involved in cell wall biosynthesis
MNGPRAKPHLTEARRHKRLANPGPAFSVIIPTWQRSNAVSEAVRALGKVTYGGPVEVIVVVDGSTDGTAEALAQLHCPVPLRVIEQDNRGLAAARNRGAAESSGEILFFLDDDMICEPDMLDQHARMYRDGADAVAGNIPLHPDSPPGILTEAIATAAVLPAGTQIDPFHICGGQLSVTRVAFDALGGFDEEFCSDGAYGDEDVEFAIRLFDAYDVRHNPAAVSRQLNLVSAGDFMNRAKQLARADLRLIAKHPHIRKTLLRLRGNESRSARLLYWPASGIPLFPQLLAKAAVGACETLLKTRYRSSRVLARFFVAARWISYWSVLRQYAGSNAARELLRH